MMTNSLLFQIQMSEPLCGGEPHDNLSPHSQPPSLCPCIKLVHSSATKITIECQNDNSVIYFATARRSKRAIVNCGIYTNTNTPSWP